MTHREKVKHLVADLGKRKVGASTVAPPLFRLLWAIGLEVPPPFFMRFIPLTLLCGVFFGCFWGLFIIAYHALVWAETPADLIQSLPFLIPVSAGAGLFFGLSMAAYFRWKAKQLGLPAAWEDYPGAEPGSD